ncbi:MAG TPA: amidase [Rhodocyclaceae bacterium]|nr:amidase [Rhodocyclaceae bacterium]
MEFSKKPSPPRQDLAHNAAGADTRTGAFSRREFLQAASALGVAAGALGTGAFGLAGRAEAAQGAPAALPRTIAEAGQLLRSGATSSEQLTRTYFAAIEKLEPKLNAFITLLQDRAIAAARARDAELAAGRDLGPLHGIPIVTKDIFDTAGIVTTVGSKAFENRVPDTDATVIRRLEAAGAVILGKTNMNEFAAGVTGTNDVFGNTHNPWMLGRSPGGSSGGTGAAIAAGLCLGGTGTDTGGSIRVPASWCGIAGIRPSYGLVSLNGVYPRAYSLDVAGPLAPTVGDLAVLLDAMAGYDPKYEHSSLAQRRASYADVLGKGVAGMRLGIVRNYTYRDVDDDVAAAIRQAADTFARLGAEIVEIEVPPLEGELDYAKLFSEVLLYEFNQILGDEYRATPDRERVFGSIVQRNIAVGEKVERTAYERTLRSRAELTARVKKAFDEVDTMLTPALPMVAPALDAPGEVFARGRQFTLPFSFTALPSVVVPCGFNPEGLPIGLQIVGNHFEEALLLQMASTFEQNTDHHKKRPAIHAEALA